MYWNSSSVMRLQLVYQDSEYLRRTGSDPDSASLEIAVLGNKCEMTFTVRYLLNLVICYQGPGKQFSG